MFFLQIRREMINAQIVVNKREEEGEKGEYTSSSMSMIHRHLTKHSLMRKKEDKGKRKHYKEWQ